MADDKQVRIDITADVSGLNAGVKDANAQLNRLGSGMRDFQSEAAAAANKTHSFDAAMMGASSAARESATRVEAVARTLGTYSDATDMVRLSVGKFGSSSVDMADKQQHVQQELRRTSLEMDRAANATKQAEGRVIQFTKVSNFLRDALASVGVGFSAAAVIGKLVSVQREFDVLNSSLVTVTGSSANAAREFEWITEFASTTPYQLNDVTSAFVKMKALGLDASQAALTSYGNTASAMGKSLNQMIEAVADAATGEFERLKEFGIRANAEGDRVTFTFQGVSTTVKNNAEEISGYLRKIGEVEFAGAMAERAKTLDGALSNLADTWDGLFRAVSSANTGGLIFDTVTTATSAVEELRRVIALATPTEVEHAKAVGEMNAAYTAFANVAQAISVLGANISFVFRVLANDLVSSSTAVGYAMTAQFGMAKKTLDQAASYAAAQRAELDRYEKAVLSGAKVERAAAEDKAQSAAKAAKATTDMAKAKKESADLDNLLADTSAAKAKEIAQNEALLAKAFASHKIGAVQYAEAIEALEKSITGYTEAEWAAMEANHLAATQQETLAQAEASRVAAAVQAQASLNAVFDDAFEAEERRLEIQNQAIASLDEYTRDLEFEVSLLGLSNTARAKAIAVRNLEKAGIDATSQAYQDYLARLAAAISKQDGFARLNEQVAEQADTWRDIERTAHDTFVSIMDGGKDAWTRLKDTAKNIFFDWLYQMTLKKWIIGASFSASSAAATQAFGANAAGAGGVGGGGGAGNALGMAGSAIGLGESFAAMASAQTWGTLGASLTSGSLSTAASGLMNFAAAAGPVVAAILAVGALVSAFSTGGTPHQGTSMQFGLGGDTSTLGRADLGGQLPNWLADMGDSSPFADAVEQLGISMVQQLNADMASLGGTLGEDFALQFGFAAEREAETASGGFARVMLGGETVLEIYDRYAKDGKKGIEQFAADVLPRVRLAGIQMAEGLSPALDAMADSLDPATASVRDINDLLVEIGNAGAALNLQATFADLGMTLGTTDQQVIDTGTALADLAGGFGQLQSGLAGYYQAFYDGDEQMAILSGNLSDQFAALGLTMPATREGFRALVEGLDLTDAADRALYTSLIALAPALGQVIDAADSDALEAATKATDLANTRRGLEIDLMEAQGDMAGALAAQRELELAAMDDSLDGLQQSVWAAQDAAAVESSRREMEIALMRATGDEAGALAAERERELAALDPSLRALQQQVWAAEDAAAATKELTIQIGAMADRFQSTYDTIGGIADILGGGDLGQTLATEMQFVRSQMETEQAWLAENARYNPIGGVTSTYLQHQQALQRMQAQMAELTGQYNLYLAEEAAHPGFGSQLLELANWYEEQQAALAGNLEGQALLELAYQQRRNEILAEGIESGLDELSGQLDDWLHGLTQGDLSPLTDQAQLDAARADYEAQLALARGGDQEARGNITGYFEDYLRAAEAVMGHAGDYTAIYSGGIADIRDLARGGTANGPAGVAPASSADVSTLNATVANRLASLEQTMGRLLERLTGEQVRTRNEIVAAVSTSGDRTTRAITNTAVLEARA
jgi:hypothetical protein